MQQNTPQYREAWHTNHDGFSLLELVVAVSIMLILAVVGTVSYQAYTENARQAALDTSANKVLTAVVAEDNVPNGDVEEAVKTFNNTSSNMTVDITSASTHGITVEATTCEGGSGVVSAPGDYSHVETTSFSDTVYTWTGAAHTSHSQKIVCGEVVQTNYATNPVNAVNDGWHSSNHLHTTIERVALTDHPLGITTGVRSVKTADSDRAQSLALYKVGGQEPTEYGYHTGIWVKSTMPGRAVLDNETTHARPVPANTWVFVVSENPKEENYPGVRIFHDTPEIASAATSWATGAIVTYNEPPVAYFDGDTR